MRICGHLTVHPEYDLGDIFVLRLLMGLSFAWAVWWAPTTMISDGVYPLYFYLMLLFIYAVHQVRALQQVHVRAVPVLWNSW